MIDVRWSPGFRQYYATVRDFPYLFAYGDTPELASELLHRRIAEAGGSDA